MPVGAVTLGLGEFDRRQTRLRIAVCWDEELHDKRVVFEDFSCLACFVYCITDLVRSDREYC